MFLATDRAGTLEMLLPCVVPTSMVYIQAMYILMEASSLPRLATGMMESTIGLISILFLASSIMVQVLIPISIVMILVFTMLLSMLQRVLSRLLRLTT